VTSNVVDLSGMASELSVQAVFRGHDLACASMTSLTEPRKVRTPARHAVCPGDAEQGPGDHALFLDHQGALYDRRGDGRRLLKRDARLRPDENNAISLRRPRCGSGAPVLGATLRALDLLGVGRADQHRRHPDHGQPHGQLRGLARDDDDRLQHRPQRSSSRPGTRASEPSRSTQS